RCAIAATVCTDTGNRFDPGSAGAHGGGRLERVKNSSFRMFSAPRSVKKHSGYGERAKALATMLAVSYGESRGETSHSAAESTDRRPACMSRVSAVTSRSAA